MSKQIATRLIALSLMLSTATLALAGGPLPDRSGARHRHGADGGLLDRRDHSCGNCRIEMRTVQRVVYEPVVETRETTVYDLIWEQETIQDTQRRVVMQTREVPYTYYRTILETQTRDVSYTTYRSFPETQTREVSYLKYVPVPETRTVTVPYTVASTVEEQRTRTVYTSVPRQVTCTRTIHVRTGHWETRAVEDHDKSYQKGGSGSKGDCCRVWVPCIEERQVAQTRTVHDLKAQVVPYTVTRVVPVTLTRDVTRTCIRMVPVQQTRLVHYQVMRNIPEQHVRTVPYVVRRQVPETGTRVETFPVCHDVPVSRVVDVPRQVPRTVCYKVTRMVPRTECVQVPVRVCAPSDPGGSKQKGGDDKVTEAAPKLPSDAATDVTGPEDAGQSVALTSSISG